MRAARILVSIISNPASAYPAPDPLRISQGKSLDAVTGNGEPQRSPRPRDTVPYSDRTRASSRDCLERNPLPPVSYRGSTYGGRVSGLRSYVRVRHRSRHAHEQASRRRRLEGQHGDEPRVQNCGSQMFLMRSSVCSAPGTGRAQSPAAQSVTYPESGRRIHRRVAALDSLQDGFRQRWPRNRSFAHAGRVRTLGMVVHVA